MKRITLTGATSMLGCALIEECVKNNTEVLAFVHKGSSKIGRLPKSGLIETIECDLDGLKDFAPQDSQRADVFYHFAWGSTDKSIRDAPEPQLKNIEYAFDAVNLAQRLGCKKFVGAGSQAEYGVAREPIAEETRVNPLTSYGVAKFAAGKLCMKLCAQKGMDCVWPRIFSVYGEGESPKALVSYTIDCILRGEKASFSAATNDWDYLYRSDAARFLYALGEKPCESGVYNIASGKSRKLKDFIAEVEAASGKKLDCEFSLAPLGESTPHLNCDISKLVKATGIEPAVSFADGVKRMVAAKRNNHS